MMKQSLIGGLLLAVSVTLAGCGGGGAESETQVKNTTVSKGQALIDLKHAYDVGAISESEYERERDAVLYDD